MEWREFFYFNKSDRMVILSIVVFSVVVWLVVSLLGDVEEVGRNMDVASQDSLSIRDKQTGGSSQPASHPYESYYVEGRSVERFAFDPNTADSTQFLRLGLAPWQVRNIYKYRAAGGHYTQPSDFAKLYGLTAKQYKQLEPYIHISKDYRPAAKAFEYEPTVSKDTVRYPRKITLQQRIAVNTADTTLLMRIPGIGHYYARAIVEYRNRLGGFVDLNQLKEIEGFPESTLQYMCIPDDRVRKIKINKLTVNQLKAHPYINFYQARDIVEYRRQRGPIRDISQLSMLPDFPIKDIERLRPYLEY